MSLGWRKLVPEGWTVDGFLPDFDPAEATDLELAKLTEDLLQIRSPGSAYMIDVGWHPEMDRAGGFVCQVVQDDDWDTPLDRMQTRNPYLVRAWLSNALGGAATALGVHP